MNIVPGINCGDEACVRGVIAQAAAFLSHGSWLHLDVADGRFTFHKTWNDSAKWPALNPGYALEVHLMVEEPERVARDWLSAGAKRIIVHWEAIAARGGVLDGLIALASGHGAELFLAINPETPLESAISMVGRLPGFQVLAVTPGLSGQKFQPLVLDKVRRLRKEFPNVTIEVDGGITPKTAFLARAAGADQVAVTSFIFNNPDPKHAYQTLTSI